MAQSDRDHLRHGNRLYHDQNYAKAEVEYRKSLEKNGSSTNAQYNLANALMLQGKAKDAMKLYEQASKCETSKQKLAQIYHHEGVILQSQKQYQQAIECYKNSLRNNPHDNETRYNLALCQKMLKNQGGQDNKDNKDKKDQNKDKDKDKDKKQDKKDDKKNQDTDKNKNKDQDKDKPQQQQPKQNQMSKENAEQLLNAAVQNEKQVQEKMKRAAASSKRKLEKDW